MYGQSDSTLSPTRRSSIEKLQKASRVKNSSMFAREQKQEYDPTSVPLIERPLARPIQGNAFGGKGLQGLKAEERARLLSHKRSESKSNIPIYSPSNTFQECSAEEICSPMSSNRQQTSPSKSSLALRNFNTKTSLVPENEMWSEGNSVDENNLPEGRSLHRHAKSVTFDAAPPQVNEYEMATPDLSSIGTGSRENSYDSAEDDEEGSYSRGELDDHEDSFDASLEDTDKTPVVGPDDWRHVSPSSQQGIIGEPFEDPFQGPEGSPMPEMSPAPPLFSRPASLRNDSLNSNGDPRPLPPLPGLSGLDLPRPQSSHGLTAATERASSFQRNLPSSPEAPSISKSDIHSMAGSKMTLEERLRLMMIQDDDKSRSAAELQRERRMRRAGARERGSQTPERDNGDIYEDEDTLGELGEYQLPSRISRESILRKVNAQDPFRRESDYNFSSPAPSPGPERAASLDPDIPIPSTEEDLVLDEDQSLIIKSEPMEDEIDLSSITDMYGRTESRLENYDDDSTTLQGPKMEEDDESEYSNSTPVNPRPQGDSNNTEDEGPPTPRRPSPIQTASGLDSVREGKQVSLPEIPSFLSDNDFGLSLQTYMTPSPPPPVPAKDSPKEHASMPKAQEHPPPPTTPASSRYLPKPEYDGSGWGPEEYEDEAGTPESVIRHPIPSESSPSNDSPSIPEQAATIKSASGSKLKTRPSATPSDLVAMREARRQISSEMPSVPPIPERHRSRPSFNLDRSADAQDGKGEEGSGRQSSFTKKRLTLDIGDDLGSSLNKDFDRVIEAQKVAFDPSILYTPSFNDNGQVSTNNDSRQLGLSANVTSRKQRGYLMRQNTKVVVATSDVDRGTRSAGNSPVKKERPMSWTVEPWNGQTHKKSVRESVSPRKKIPSGPVPPMPGHDSNVTGFCTVAEEEDIVSPNTGEGGERGRLFVKVVSVKDLDLPLPKSKSVGVFGVNKAKRFLGERAWFSLTLDNGVHCVTTAWLELGKNAPIGQEFELVVPSDLEFQLTLNARLEKPEPRQIVQSPIKNPRPSKKSTFSRVFTSPKKRKELEMRQREEEKLYEQQKEREAQAKRLSTQPTAWDLLSPLAAEDGSFARSYVCLKDHESRCFGRPYVVDVICYNEWATDEVTINTSIKSKRVNTPVQRRAPYKIGKLELQLLFVPRPKGAKDEDIPKSMNSCIREMREVESSLARSWEGYLSQQGGDCPVSLGISFLMVTANVI